MTTANKDEQLKAAIRLLAEWVVNVGQGTSWDYWDECYKKAKYHPGVLRELLDTEIENVKGEWGIEDDY